MSHLHRCTSAHDLHLDALGLRVDTHYLIAPLYHLQHGAFVSVHIVDYHLQHVDLGPAVHVVDINGAGSVNVVRSAVKLDLDFIEC